jgi:tRNA(His) 5'-end guanylyltransferase
MKSVTRYLVNNIQGCVLGYTQSDEISLVLQDYKKQDTDAWFGYNVQKLVSVSAKMATAHFGKVFVKAMWNYVKQPLDVYTNSIPMESVSLYMNAFEYNNVGFDSRCWNLPVDEVNNYLIDRQQDAERNSLNLLAQQYYTQKELNGINAKQLQNKLFVEKGVNWNDLDTCEKRGYIALPPNDPEHRYCETPIFSKNPSFVNSRIIFK